MKVLVVIDSLGLGGAENLLTVLASAAPAAGLELHVASLAPASRGRLALQPLMEQAGLPVSFLDIPKLAYPGAVRRIARAVTEHEADVVHAHLGYSATLAPPAARLVGRGCASTLHHVPGPMDLRDRVKERLSIEVAGRLGTLVFVSDASRHEFAELYPERASWRTVHNGVDLSRFVPGRLPLPVELAIPAGAPVVTIVAALREPKGHRIAIEGWSRVLRTAPEARLLVVGDGDERARLDAQARDLGLADRVVFAGMRHDVPELMRGSSVVALPSFTEALPTVLIEAGACGLPTVATSVGGTPEVVDNGSTGLLVAPGDVDGFAGAVAGLLADPARAGEMGQAARSFVSARFDADRWAERLREVYEQTPSARLPWHRLRAGTRSTPGPA